MNKIIVIDTSIMCCWLNIPGKETCGPQEEQWDHQKVIDKIQIENTRKTTFVLPLATIIETGNHIAQASNNRFNIACEFAQILNLTAERQTPWAAFTDQTVLWDVQGLKALADNFPNYATQGLSIGDATIKEVADYYSKTGSIVEIFTGDQQLRAYQPAQPQKIPRRRK